MKCRLKPNSSFTYANGRQIHGGEEGKTLHLEGDDAKSLYEANAGSLELLEEEVAKPVSAPKSKRKSSSKKKKED